MGKQTKRLLAMFLAFAMTITSVSFDAFAEPATDVVKEAESIAAEAQETANETKTTKKSTTKKAQKSDTSTEVETSTFSVGNAMTASLEEDVQDSEVDMSNPEVKTLEKELKEAEVTDEEGEKTALTEEQIQTILYLFQQYLDQWAANADVLGVQSPFYLQYNDNGEDGLGVLGEMLVLAGKSVDDVRNGDYSYDDVIGMIQNFLYGDKYALEYYADEVKSQRDAALNEVKESGAKTQIQKYLVLNDWLAQENTFDMAYIMNSGTAEMVAEEPVKNEHYDTIYKDMYDMYHESIYDQFYDQIYAQVKQGVYDNVYDQQKEGGATDEEAKAAAEAYVESEEGKKAIEDQTLQTMDSVDPSTIPEGGTEADGMTFNQEVDLYAEKAATGLTDGIIGYWQGNHIGALALGSSVCMGYSKAYAYLIQCLDADIYTTDGNYKNASSWKTTEELYYTDGKLDTTKNYTVDLVRITFDAEVTMYGQTQENFGSDHFWNAVQVDGKWYYIDPCYTDVYTEVMSRDRVEVNGNMNHLYFMFSDTTARQLYDGYFKEIKSLYQDVATDTSYEDSWISRIKSNTYSDGSSAYYVYDSTDLIKMLNDYNNNTGNYDELEKEQKNVKYKIVKHDLSLSDDDNGDEDYSALIEFNYKENEDDEKTVARVYNPETKEMEENAELTKYFAQYKDQKSVYPSIAITMALQGEKIYFNLSNAIFSYDLTTGEIVNVKEYNEVFAKRDKTVALGGMAFNVVEEASDDTLEVENAPIAGLTLKNDGNLYVDIATNYAYISGKDAHDMEDKSSYGYEFQESNYNPDYNTFANNSDYSDDMVESMGYKREKNDNDEFMWTAVFHDKIAMTTITGSHEYEKVSVEATCGRDAYTENRCKDCGVIEAGSRVYEEGSAEDHHYVHLEETYYTKKDDNWNTGDCYVCTTCGYAVESDDDGTDEDWDESKDTYEMAKEKAGHVYSPVEDANVEWAEDNKSVTITDSSVVCETCDGKKLDCLLDTETPGGNSAYEKVTLDNVTATLSDVKVTTSGTCEEGVEITYVATGKTEDGVSLTATKVEKTEAGKHAYDAEFTWTKAEDGSYTATANLKCTACGKELKDQTAEVKKEVVDPTCEEEGKTVYTATVTPEDGEACVDTKEEDVKPALGHKWKSAFTWNEDKTEASAILTCENDETHKTEAINAAITEEVTKEVTCTEDGEVVRTATVVNEGETYTDKVTVVVPATGHKYAEPKFDWTEDEDGKTVVYANFTCETCEDVHTEKCDVTSETTEATCTEDGKTVDTAKCTFDGKDYTDAKTTVIPATGHTYDLEKQPEFAWAEDNQKATATFTCTTCGEKHSEDCKVTEKTDDATCTEAGTVTYTATVTFKDKTFTTSKTVEGKPLGHTYGEPKVEWSDDLTKATATYECTRCHAEDAVQKKDCDVSHKTTKEATYVEKGVETYTATVDGKVVATKEVEIAKLDPEVKFDKEAVVYATEKVTLTLDSKYADDKITSTKTNNTTYASTSRDGKTLTIFGKKGGETYVTIKTASKETIKVPVRVKTPSVKLSATKLPMKVKTTTYALKITDRYKHYNNYITKVTSSSTSRVKAYRMKKSSGGYYETKVKLVAQGRTGKATIKIYMSSGAVKTCTVTVQKSSVKATSISLNASSVNLKLSGEGKKTSFDINTTRYPLTATTKIYYKSSNTKVATVSSSGLIKAKKSGSATITVTCGSKKKTVKVKVVK